MDLSISINSLLVESALITLGSFIGSLHCIGMCGGFACLAATGCKARDLSPRNEAVNDKLSVLPQDTASGKFTVSGKFIASSKRTPSGRFESLRLLNLYHFGRLITYLTLTFLLFFSSMRLSEVSGIGWIPVVILLGINLSYLLSALFQRSTNYDLLGSLASKGSSALGRVLNVIARQKFLPASLLLGMVSTMIPCGWLYLYVGLAGTKPTVIEAGAAIFAFWLGTLPALSTAGWVSTSLRNTISPRYKIIAHVIIVTLSMMSIYTHFSHAGSSSTNNQTKSSGHCH